MWYSLRVQEKSILKRNFVQRTLYHFYISISSSTEIFISITKLKV